MGFAPDGYYAYDDFEGGFYGLIRISGNGLRFEQARKGVWTQDQTLLRNFTDPGSKFLEPIDDTTAAQLAARYRVALT